MIASDSRLQIGFVDVLWLQRFENLHAIFEYDISSYLQKKLWNWAENSLHKHIILQYFYWNLGAAVYVYGDEV